MIENMKITLAESWDEVPLKTYQELAQLPSDQDNLSRIIDVVSIFSDVDSEEIRKISTSELSKIGEAIKWAVEIPSSEFKHIIKIDDEEYSLIEFKKMTVGEWIDVDSFLENSIMNMHKLMAILYRPLVTAINDRTRFVEEYDVDKMNVRAELFKEKIMIGDVYGTLLFFCNIGKRFLNHLRDSSKLIQVMNPEMMES